jgi:excisionase family DNA binding protein
MSVPSLNHPTMRDALTTKHDADYVGISEAARLLGLSADTVRLRYDEGLLSGYRTPSGHRRISRDSILAMLEAGR